MKLDSSALLALLVLSCSDGFQPNPTFSNHGRFSSGLSATTYLKELTSATTTTKKPQSKGYSRWQPDTAQKTSWKPDTAQKTSWKPDTAQKTSWKPDTAEKTSWKPDTAEKKSSYRYNPKNSSPSFVEKTSTFLQSLSGADATVAAPAVESETVPVETEILETETITPSKPGPSASSYLRSASSVKATPKSAQGTRWAFPVRGNGEVARADNVLDLIDLTPMSIANGTSTRLVERSAVTTLPGDEVKSDNFLKQVSLYQNTTAGVKMSNAKRATPMSNVNSDNYLSQVTLKPNTTPYGRGSSQPSTLKSDNFLNQVDLYPGGAPSQTNVRLSRSSTILSPNSTSFKL